MKVRHFRVLVFQEDATVLDAVRADLEQDGFEVTCARSFIEAAPVIVGTDLDVLLIYLPDIEWRQRAVINQVKRANARLPIVAVASPAAGSRNQKLADMGIDLILPAQVGHSALVEVIRQIGEGSRDGG